MEGNQLAWLGAPLYRVSWLFPVLVHNILDMPGPMQEVGPWHDWNLGPDQGICPCRAARYCHAAAYGGQITAPFPMVQSVLSVWTGMPAVDFQMANIAKDPHHLPVSQEISASLLPWKASCSPASPAGNLDPQSTTRSGQILCCFATTFHSSMRSI